MRRSLTLLGVMALAILLVSSASAANRGTTFTSIGFAPGSTGPFAASQIYSMSPDGQVFMASPSYFGNYCWEWTRDGGWGTEVGDAASVCRISNQGTVMGSGYFDNFSYYTAATWAGEPDVWSALPLPDGFEACGSGGTSFFDMGGDGDYATGLTWEGCNGAQAFRWDKATNTSVALGSPNGDSSRGNAISDDGSTIVGWARQLFGDWRGARYDDGAWSWIDGQGNIDPLACKVSGKSCTSNSADPVYGCPGEYVDDAKCDTATCTGGICVGGPNGGNTCSYDYDCAGYCAGGPNDGDVCTSDYYCPDTAACDYNPLWSDDAYKGEARDVSADGRYVTGRNYGYNSYPYDDPHYDALRYLSGYVENPDGSFTQIPPPDSFVDTWEPAQISDNGETVVGQVGNPFFGAIPAFWNRQTGTQDLQLFLVQQGLDELYFWYLTSANAVSADGAVIAGAGGNPDGLLEGFIVDLHKVWVCHQPPGHPENARTLGISLGSVGDHLAHGDFLGTCEFLNSGGLSRAAALRERLNQRMQSEDSGMSTSPYLHGGGPSTWTNPATPSITVRPTATRRGARAAERVHR